MFSIHALLQLENLKQMIAIDAYRKTTEPIKIEALHKAAEKGHLAVVRCLFNVDLLRKAEIRELGLNFVKDQTVNQQINALINCRAKIYPKLKASLERERNTEATAFYTAWRHIKHGNNNIYGIPKDIANMIAWMIKTSPPGLPPAPQSDNPSSKKQKLQ